MIVDLHIDIPVLKAIANDNETAFKNMFNQHKSNVFSLAYHFTKSIYLAEEITQEVFESVWRYRNKMAEADDTASYFYSIIANKSIAVLKKQKKNSQLTAILKEETGNYTTKEPNQCLIEKENAIIYNTIIKEIPQKRREIYLLREEGYSILEIAQKLHIAENTVKNQLKAARNFIKEKVSKALLLIAFITFCLL